MKKALEGIPEADVIAFSLLAVGYLGHTEAIEYAAKLPNLKGVVVGVSKTKHARQTFKLLRENSPNGRRLKPVRTATP